MSRRKRKTVSCDKYFSELRACAATRMDQLIFSNLKITKGLSLSLGGNRSTSLDSKRLSNQQRCNLSPKSIAKIEQLYLISNYLTQPNESSIFFKYDIVDFFEFDLEQVDSSQRQREYLKIQIKKQLNSPYFRRRPII